MTQEQIYNSNEYLPPRPSKHYTIPVICVDSDDYVYYDINERCWYTFGGETIDVERWKFEEPVKVGFNDPKYNLWKHMVDEHDLTLLDGELWDIINIVRELDSDTIAEDKSVHQLSANEQIEKLTKTFEELLIDQFVICELRDVWRKRAGLTPKCEE